MPKDFPTDAEMEAYERDGGQDIRFEAPEQPVREAPKVPSKPAQGQSLMARVLASLAAKTAKSRGFAPATITAPPANPILPNASRTFGAPRQDQGPASTLMETTDNAIKAAEKLKNKFFQGAVYTAVTSPQSLGALITEMGERAEEEPNEADINKSFLDLQLGNPMPISPKLFKQMKSTIFKMTDADDEITKSGREMIDRNRVFVKKFFPGYEDPGESFGEQLSYNLGSGSTTLAAAMGISIATGSPMASSILFGGYQKGQLYDEMRAAGLDPRKAGEASTIGGLIEGSLEFVGLSAMLTKFSKSFMADIIGHALSEAGQEFMQTVGENVVTQGVGARPHEKFADFFSGAGMSALVGALLGGGMNATMSLAERSGVIKELEKQGVPKDKAKKAAYPVIKAMKSRAEAVAKFAILQQQAANSARGPMPQINAEIPILDKLRENLIKDLIAANKKLGEEGFANIGPSDKNFEIVNQNGMKTIKAKPGVSKNSLIRFLLSNQKPLQVENLTGATLEELKIQALEFVEKWSTEETNSPAFNGEKVSIDETPFKYATDNKRTESDQIRRLKLFPKAKAVIKNIDVVDEVRELPGGLTRYSLIGKFSDGSVVRVILEEKSIGGKKFLSVFDLWDEKIKTDASSGRASSSKEIIPQAHQIIKQANIPGKPMFHRPSWTEMKFGISEEEMARRKKEGRAFIEKHLPELASHVQTPEALYVKGFAEVLGYYYDGTIAVRADQALPIWKHEAGHAFFNLFVSDANRLRYIDLVKESYKKRVDQYAKEYQVSEARAAEEILMELAEKVDGKTYVYDGKKIPARISLFLNEIIRRIRALLGSKKAKLGQFFKDFYSNKREVSRQPGFTTGLEPNPNFFTKAITITGDIRKRGYLNVDSLEANGYSLKEYPALRQLARKDGKLNLDELAEEYTEAAIIPTRSDMNPIDVLIDHILDPDKRYMPEHIERMNITRYEKERLGSMGYSASDVEKALKFDTSFDTDKFDNEKLKIEAKRIKEILKTIESKFPSILRKNKTKRVIADKTGIKDTSELREISERDLLRAQMKSKAQAAKWGYREGNREARRALLTKYMAAKVDLKARKAAVAEYINESAPEGLKRNLLSIAKGVQTDAQVLKAFNRVDDIIQKHQKKTAIKEIKTLFGRADKARNISVEYRDMIGSIESEIGFTRPRQETINRLRKTKAWLTRELAAGKDVTVPKRIYEAVQGLEKTSIHDYALTDLYILYDTLETMFSLGTVSEQNRRSAFIKERGEIAKQLIEAPTQKVEAKEMIDKIRALTPNETAQNLYRTTLNKLQALDLNISPMDAIFDMFDKGAGYTGAWYTNFKRRVDINFGNFLGGIWQLKDETNEKVKALGLDETNFKRIGVHAALQQVDGLQKLLNNGYTEAEVRAIKLEPKEKEFYDWMRSKLDEMLPRIQDMMATVFNQPVGEVSNYFPFMTDFEALNELEAAQRLFDAEDRARLQSKPNLQFTQERVGAGKQKIRIDALDTFLNHMENAHYAVNMAYTNKMLAEILEDVEIEKRVGLRGKTIIKQWLDVVNKKGGASGQQYIKGLDVLRHNLGVATLGFRLSSAAIQPTALLDGAALIGGYAFQGAQDIALSKRWRGLVAKFPEIKDRVGDDPAFRDSIEGGLIGKPLDKVQKVGMKPLRYLDGKTAASVAAGAYRKFMKENKRPVDFSKIDEEAMQYAQQIVRRTQASSSFKDSPLAISRGKLLERFENRSLARLLLQYQTFMLTRWSRLRRDLPNQFKRKEYGAVAQNVFFWQMALITEVLVRNFSQDVLRAIFGGKDDDRDFLEKYFAAAFQTVPFVGQAVSSIYYKSIPIPVIEQIAKMRDDVRYLDRSKTPEARGKWAALVLLDALSLRGLPGTSQVSDIIRKQKVKKTSSYFV